MSEQKRIVITGVSRGLGRAMTEQFIRRGHVVLGCARSSRGIAALRNQFPAPHDFAVVDVSQEIQVGAWAVEGMTQALAEELPAGMAAVPLNPGIIHTEMLESCFGKDATAHPGPDRWAQTAVLFLLGLRPRDNGKPLTVPS